MKKIFRLLPVFATFFLFASPSIHARENNDSTEKPSASTASETISSLQAKAAAGDLSSLFSLALRYERGDGVPKNPQKAYEMALKGAELGHHSAQALVGRFFQNGFGVKQDYKIAGEWYKKAADQGSAMAEIGLASLLEKGLGVAKNEPLAASLYKRAAELGYPDAAASLGLMLEDGRGVEKNISQAMSWYRKCAEPNRYSSDGTPFCQWRLGVSLMGSGKSTEGLILVKKAAEKSNYGIILNELGNIYEHGLGGVPKDDRLAFEWYKKAADTGLAVAKYNLGRMYESGQGVMKNEELADLMYVSAIYGGDKKAAEQLKVLREKRDQKEKAELADAPAPRPGCHTVYETEPTTDVTNECDYNNFGPTNCHDVIKSGSRQVAREVCNAK